jgi:glutamate-1-semialdehyde 2,1-aminomutase
VPERFSVTGGASAACAEEERRFRARTPTSARWFAEACRHLPGGDSRSPLFHRPYPVTLAGGAGSRVADVDGNELLDLTGNHTTLVHGYGHPGVLAAVQAQLASGTCFPAPTPPQVRMARLLGERIRSMQRVRFTNSGTEAVMLAVRSARAFTGRPLIAVAEGAYHGTWDGVMVRSPGGGGPEAASAGLAPGSPEAVVVLPFDDPQGAVHLLEEHAEELAAVLVEPVQGSAGMIPATREYLSALRAASARHGILLVFDEVVSVRVAPGGAQQHFGVFPDLTCLGKAVGGGFPLGVFGGRADVMAAFDPSAPGGPRIPHPGSLNANPVSLAAGCAALEALTEAAVARINRLGERLRDRLRQVFTDAGVPAQVTGLGSLFGVHFTPEPVTSVRQAAGADPGLRQRLFLGLFDEGVLIDPRGVGSVSTALSDDDLATALSAITRVLQRWVR